MNRNIYDEQSAVQRLLRNGFKKENDKNRRSSDVISESNGYKIIKIASNIGLKLRSAVDYLKNYCNYIIMWV